MSGRCWQAQRGGDEPAAPAANMICQSNVSKWLERLRRFIAYGKYDDPPIIQENHVKTPDLIIATLS